MLIWKPCFLDLFRTNTELFCIRALPESKVDFVVASATDISSIPEAPEGTFDFAICIYVLCNLLSKEEVPFSGQHHLSFLSEFVGSISNFQMTVTSCW